MPVDGSSASPRSGMTAIILAAGIGRRLGNVAPKIMLEFGGRTLLERHIAALRANGITDVAITVGSQADVIRRELERLDLADQVTLVDNPRYRDGSIVSLWAQRAQLSAGRPILLMDGDVLYDHRMIARLLAATPENALLLDRAIETGDEPVKICLRGNVIADFAKKPEHAHDWHGESVGFFRFSAPMATALAKQAAAYVEAGQVAAEYETALRDLILADPDRFGYEDISDLPWTEIDFDADITRARQEILPRIEARDRLASPDHDHQDADQAGVAAGPLTVSQVRRYHEAGWLLARGFFGPSEVAEMARWTDDLVNQAEEPGKHMVYHEPSLIDAGARVVQRIENFCPYHTGFDAFARCGKLRDAVDQLLGASSCLFKEKINFKMPGGSGFEPHQDQQAGWSRYASIFLTALVSIDRATVENGCMEMADAPRFSRLIGEEWRPLSAAEMDGFALVPVPTEPGDVLFFDSYAPHASKPNLTDRARRVLYLTYNRRSDGDHRTRYFAEKRANFPPDVERPAGVSYKFRV